MRDSKKNGWFFLVIAVWLGIASCTPSAPEPTVFPTVDRIVLPTAVPTVPPTVAPTPTHNLVTGKISANTRGDKVNVRGGPGTSFAPIGSLLAGKVIQITGKSPNSQWWRVSADGLEGWVFSSYVIVDGNFNAVPCVPVSSGDCAAAQAPSQNDAAIANIRTFLDNPDQNLFFYQEMGNPNADMRASLVFMDPNGGEYWVDAETLQVVQWTPRSPKNSIGVKTLDVLRANAKAFGERQSPYFQKNAGKLSTSLSSKDNTTFAFRWEDRTKTGHILIPFLQVVIRTDGEIMNYHNTLDLFPN